MKISRVLPYAVVVIAYFVLLHIFWPSQWNSGVKIAIDNFFANPLGNWLFIFPFIGLMLLLVLNIVYGIFFLASFGKGYRTKGEYYPDITIVIPSKNEKILLEQTLDSLLETTYPKEHIQLILLTGESTDGTTEFSEQFAQKYGNMMDITTDSEVPPNPGKPAKLNLGIKHIKHDIVVFYDCGNILTPECLTHLVNPFQFEQYNAVIGPLSVKNWKDNALTKGVMVSYGLTDGGGLLLETRNRLGCSAFFFGRNVALRTKYLKKYGGFNENSLTEDLYLHVLLNLDGVDILFVPQAKTYDTVPDNVEVLKMQRTRWMAGFTLDAPELMEMEGKEKTGKQIIIPRNLTMFIFGNVDSWMGIPVVFAILFSLVGEYYLLFWSLSCVLFQFGYFLNAIWKYCDKHFSLLLYWPIGGFFHFYMFIRQFTLPEDLSWEQTPVILEKQTIETENLSKSK
ncbi:MAG: glycosyltransferase [Promethearchaeati archaeon]